MISSKFRGILTLMFIMVGLFTCSILLAQQDSTGGTTYPVPENVWDVITNPEIWLGSTSAVAGLTIFLTLLVSKLLTSISKIIKQLIAVGIALALIALGNFLNIGFMAEFDLVSTLVYGVVTGLMANGLYDLKNISK